MDGRTSGTIRNELTNVTGDGLQTEQGFWSRCDNRIFKQMGDENSGNIIEI